MNTGLDIGTVDLRKLNTMTKYPSISTYHEMGEKGILRENAMPFPEITKIITEKVDGTNARIIALPDSSYILGSREDLLYASGDIIHNPALGLVEHIRPFANKFRHSDNCIRVYYGELFGGKVTAASKNYSKVGNVSWRLFDVVEIWDYAEQFSKPVEELARWRENGGQRFVSEQILQFFGDRHGIPLTPRLTITGTLPSDLKGMYEFLKAVSPKSLVGLDDTALLFSEGIVIRTTNRSHIAKVRYEDYERTMRKLAK